jgi:hypothetical protein
MRVLSVVAELVACEEPVGPFAGAAGLDVARVPAPLPAAMLAAVIMLVLTISPRNRPSN